MEHIDLNGYEYQMKDSNGVVTTGYCSVKTSVPKATVEKNLQHKVNKIDTFSIDYLTREEHEHKLFNPHNKETPKANVLAGIKEGIEVIHNSLGYGIVTKIEGNIVKVWFENDDEPFRQFDINETGVYFTLK